MKALLRDEIEVNKFAQEIKLQPFKVKQIFFEIFKNQNIEIDQMTTLSKDLREELKTKFDPLSIKMKDMVEDGQTTKFAFETHDGKIIESVIIYHRQKEQHVKDNKAKLNRITLCISSQVGCPMGCSFCVTGKLGFTRNLTRDEIISQILYANNYIKNKFGKKEDGTLFGVRNVVFMGMGEPLANYDNVKKSIEIMLAQDRLSLGRRHITISTVGVVKGIQRMIDDELTVKLAISLHAPNQKLREEIIPVAKGTELGDLMKVIKDYIKATDNRIFYEYIMIKDLTDKPELAMELSKLVKGQLSHINLIPYNENPAMKYFHESPEGNIRKFKEILEKEGVTVTIRDSMGREAKGACGQLGWEKVSSDNE
ncbi:23S rRNA (adenine(2503)-C(2))-methyltransferase RlmN [Candidatus Gracilibacteria bacterium]|nr:23S rRNA (adenine(2503)-C(2))-methyltransferase RlmN [Candidatus Gracilibacteria bacterium]